MCAQAQGNASVVSMPGTEFMGGRGGHVSPNFWIRGDIISFDPQHFAMKSKVVV